MPPPRPALPRPVLRARWSRALATVALVLVASAFAVVLPASEPAVAVAASPKRWRWPVRADRVAPFRYSAREPFRAMQRRGIDIAARPGAAVRAACPGRISYAGRVPRHGLGVTVRCGALVATHLGLGRLAVRRGDRVVEGARLGAVGPAGRVRLGARRAADRFAYVDPLALLAGDPARPSPPVAPVRPSAPLGRAPRGTVPAPPPPAIVPPLRVRRAPLPAVPRPVAVPRPPDGIPVVAWGGLVVLAAGVPLGGLVRRRSRRRRVPAPAASTAPARAR